MLMKEEREKKIMELKEKKNDLIAMKNKRFNERRENENNDNN